MGRSVGPDLLSRALDEPGGEGQDPHSFEMVSGMHFQLRLTGAEVQIRNCGSPRNGTFVNGAEILGDAIVRVRVGGDRVTIEAGPVGFWLDWGGTLQEEESPGFAADHFGGLHGASAGMRQAFSQLDRLAATDVPVLLVGESGTGKELAAGAVHAASARRDRPFMSVNCGGLPPDLIDSELFGHRKGAFTGALRDRPGVLGRANGGTVFLDELDSLPPDGQRRLLRVIETGEVRAVGADSHSEADVRIIATCQQDPISSGQLREDLWQRLAVGRVDLPPLASRRDDIPLLVSRLLPAIIDRIGSSATLPPGWEIAPEARPHMRLLKRLDWPGNVRGLRNVLERAVLLAPGVEFPRLPISRAYVQIYGRPRERSFTLGPKWFELEWDHARERLKDILFEHHLDATGGNRTAAGLALGVSRRTVYNWCLENPDDGEFQG